MCFNLGVNKTGAHQYTRAFCVYLLKYSLYSLHFCIPVHLSSLSHPSSLMHYLGLPKFPVWICDALIHITTHEYDCDLITGFLLLSCLHVRLRNELDGYNQEFGAILSNGHGHETEDWLDPVSRMNSYLKIIMAVVVAVAVADYERTSCMKLRDKLLSRYVNSATKLRDKLHEKLP